MTSPASPKLRYGIVGAGVSGHAARRLLALLGSRDVPIYDRKPGAGDYSDESEFLSQAHPEALVVSPGVPLSTAWIRDFARAGGLVTSELALAVEHLEGEKIVGVTGSLGKSTTVSLIGAAARSAGFETFVGGNLGEPLAAYVADALEGRRPRAAWIALELSSYQLENAGNLGCEAAVVTYLSPNHLERYESLESYYAVKWGLLRRARRLGVINARGGDLGAWAAAHPVSVEMRSASRDDPGLDSLARRLRLVGGHNLDNVALARAVATGLGWPEGWERGITDFAGLPHRLEDLGAHGGIRFLNDSKATSMDSVRTAISAALESDARRIWLLLGGRDKKLPWKQLAEPLREPRLSPIYFGEARELVASKIGRDGPSYGGLGAALEALSGQAGPGDWVVLSPGGTSLDEFKNFEARGEFFRESVKRIFGRRHE